MPAKARRSEAERILVDVWFGLVEFGRFEVKIMQNQDGPFDFQMKMQLIQELVRELGA